MPRKARPPVERFLALTSSDGACWRWNGAISNVGYGMFALAHRKNVSAHRFAYQAFVGEITEGLNVHHECRNRWCVNPAHLRLVTPRENLMLDDTPARRNALKTHCSQGHEFTPENTKLRRGGGRACKTCAKLYLRKWWRRERGKGVRTFV